MIHTTLPLTAHNGLFYFFKKQKMPTTDGSNVDEVVDMTSRLASQFAEQWPDNTAEGCIQVAAAAAAAAGTCSRRIFQVVLPLRSTNTV